MEYFENRINPCFIGTKWTYHGEPLPIFTSKMLFLYSITCCQLTSFVKFFSRCLILFYFFMPFTFTTFCWPFPNLFEMCCCHQIINWQLFFWLKMRHTQHPSSWGEFGLYILSSSWSSAVLHNRSVCTPHTHTYSKISFDCQHSAPVSPVFMSCSIV